MGHNTVTVQNNQAVFKYSQALNINNYFSRHSDILIKVKENRNETLSKYENIVCNNTSSHCTLNACTKNYVPENWSDHESNNTLNVNNADSKKLLSSHCMLNACTKNHVSEDWSDHESNNILNVNNAVPKKLWNSVDCTRTCELVNNQKLQINLYDDENKRTYQKAGLKKHVLQDHCYVSNNKTLASVKIGFLNICGIYSKYELPEFDEFVNKYDILALAETKTMDYSNIQVKGYKIFSNTSRPKAPNRLRAIKFSDVCIMVRDELDYVCSEIGSTSEIDIGHYVTWVKINDILFGVMYIPHEHSVYNTEELFDIIQSDILNICEKENCTNVCLLGDFNARTGQLQEYEKFNKHVVDMSFDGNCNWILKDPDSCADRSSVDTTTNAHGLKLLELCTNINLRIVNGRFGTSSSLPTSKGNSVIDYMIMSPDLLTEIVTFEIENFDPLLSDVHNCLSLKLLVMYS